MQQTNFTDIMEKNHMEIPWHDYTQNNGNILINQAGLIEKASVIGRVGLIMLSCGTGAWRVRTSMNRLSKELGVTCTVDVGLMSIEFNCFDGKDCVSQSLSIANTGVNTSKLYRMEQFVDSFPKEEVHLTGEEIHKRLDEIERIHAIYSPVKLGLAAALACREGELVSLNLVTERLPKKTKKPIAILVTVLSVIFTVILFYYGMDKVLTQLANGKRTFVLNWPEWIFWSFVPIGAGCMILHFIEYCIDFCTDFKFAKRKEEA